MERNALITGATEVTRLLRGEGQPVQSEAMRKSVLENLPYVDEVIIFPLVTDAQGQKLSTTRIIGEML